MKILQIFLVLFFLIPQGLSAEGDIAARFAQNNPNSKVRINHDPLTSYLEATIFPVGRSLFLTGVTKVETYRGSRIAKSGSSQPSRFEGNRVFFHAFNETHKVFFKAYQKGLENLSLRRPLKDLNQNEQAAYWLNLYNVIVINKLIGEYPISNLRSLGKKGKENSFWSQKVAKVEGVPISLMDIETILKINFSSPLLAFGLWQGSIGGPRLLNFAFTGDNIWQALEQNAIEFVNSNRGIRNPKKGYLEISEFFEWEKGFFGNSDDQVLEFIKEYNDPEFVGGVGEVRRVKYKIYDWNIADLIGGSRHSGVNNQPGGILGSNSISNNRVSSSPISAPTNLVIGFYSAVNGEAPFSVQDLNPDLLRLLFEIRLHTLPPAPVISSFECGAEDICEIAEINFDDIDFDFEDDQFLF